MRFMMMLKANKDTEAGVMPSEAVLAAMGKFNEEMVRAGVMLAGEGLKPSSQGARLKYSHGKRTVIDGPFTESKELIAGFWLIQVKSKEEAIEWARRVPLEADDQFGSEAEIEIRPLFEMEDFDPGEAMKQEARLRAELEGRK